jgi:hypothetical protein
VHLRIWSKHNSLNFIQLGRSVSDTASSHAHLAGQDEKQQGNPPGPNPCLRAWSLQLPRVMPPDLFNPRLLDTTATHRCAFSRIMDAARVAAGHLNQLGVRKDTQLSKVGPAEWQPYPLNRQTCKAPKQQLGCGRAEHSYDLVSRRGAAAMVKTADLLPILTVQLAAPPVPALRQPHAASKERRHLPT